MDPNKLQSRDDFREGVFARDGHRCVICGGPGKDAHHIIERRLFSDGGYYLNNGATLCEKHHLEAEMTLISVEDVRAAAKIAEKDKVVPEHLYPNERIDKWGNLVLDNGQRMRGELFEDPNVQKILEQGNVLSLFTRYAKYPRTFHLRFSEGISSDDRVLPSHDIFKGKQVIAAYKLDGENTSMYRDHIHARSLDNRRHASRNWVKNFHGQIAHDIPEGWRICGENLFARHTIPYTQLDSYFYGFGVWDDKNRCLNWDETLEWFALLGITPIPTFYEGPWDEAAIQKAYPGHFRGDPGEGYVVRIRDGFAYRDFRNSCGKFVSAKFKADMRSNNDSFTHWSQKIVVPNQLRDQR